MSALLDKPPTTLRWTTMGEIADVIGGGTPRTSESENFEGGDIPWITPADLSGYTSKFISGGERFITQRGLESSSARVLPAGTVLFTSRAPIGYVAIAANPIATNQGFKSFVLRLGVLPEYVYWWLRGSKRTAESLASGTTFLELSGANAKKLPIPLVDLEEQRRIVAEIEKQFSRLDEAVANLQRVKAHLRRLTASIYQAGADGSLASASIGQHDSAESGQVLLERIRQLHRDSWRGRASYRAPADVAASDLPVLPHGWVWSTWGQLGHSQNGRPFPSKAYRDEGVKLLRPGNLHESGMLVWTDANTRCLPSRHLEENEDLIVSGGELVMNLTAQSLKDEFLGRICLTREGERCLLNQRLARLTPCGISAWFAFIVFKSRWFRTFVNGLNTGSLIQHMFTSQLQNFAFPLPPTKVQHRIVAEVERRLSIVREVEGEVDANLKRAQALRQAVLSKAFQG